MANYASLKAAIQEVIKTNGDNEITGALLQQSLLAMINSLGAAYQFAGVATPSTNPGTPDYNVFYFAGPGTYPNFNGTVIPARNVGLLSYNGTWHVSTVQTTPFSAETIVNDIIQLYDGSTPVYPRTRAEAVFFDNDTSKTLDQQFSQLGQKVDEGERFISLVGNGTTFVSHSFGHLLPGRKYRLSVPSWPWDLTGIADNVTIFQLRYSATGASPYTYIQQVLKGKDLNPYYEFIATNGVYELRIRAAVDASVIFYFEDITDAYNGLLTSVNLLNKNAEDVALGKYVYEGELYANADINTSGYIPVKENTVYYLVKFPSSSKGRFISFFDNSMKWLSDGTAQSASVTTPASCGYMRVSYITSVWGGDAQITEGGSLPETPFDLIVRPELIKKVSWLSSQRASGILESGARFTLPVTFISRNVELSAFVDGAFTEIEIGIGVYANQPSKVVFTPTQLLFYLGSSLIATKDHGLTIGERTFISIRTPQKPNEYNNQVAEIKAVSSGVVYKTSQMFDGVGNAYLKNNGASSITASLSFFPCDIDKPVWLFGDSYMGWSNPARWVAQCVKDNNLSFLCCAYPGGTSSQVFIALGSVFTMGVPKVALWGLGMNDGADSETPNATWLNYVNAFISVCKNANVTPVLATIPSIPTKNHEQKNTWVRNSGYRYVDFAKAVNAQADGTWGDGYLSNDGVHPSQNGAIMLYHQVLIDMPEISNQI